MRNWFANLEAREQVFVTGGAAFVAVVLVYALLRITSYNVCYTKLLRTTAPAGAPDEEVEFYWVGTEARIAGTVVHRWLQALAEDRIGGDPADPDLRDRLTGRWLRELGIGDNLRDGIALRA